jgi:hypothetical protein
MSDMDLVLLESMGRDAIVVSVRVMRHRRIPVIAAKRRRPRVVGAAADHQV